MRWPSWTKEAPAFSLIEVVIALGVITFAITAITGLLSVALKSSRASTDETLVASFAGDIMSDLRRRQFTNAWNSLQAGSNVFFDGSGRPINEVGAAISSETARAQGAVYQCAISTVPDTNKTATTGAENLRLVTLDFTWPVGQAAPPNRRIIHASLVRSY
jgi:uncharacterized protein (TIGR02598 family)